MRFGRVNIALVHQLDRQGFAHVRVILRCQRRLQRRTRGSGLCCQAPAGGDSFDMRLDLQPGSPATQTPLSDTTHRALNPFWTLAVEEQFYLIWPLLIMLAPRPVAVQSRDS